MKRLITKIRKGAARLVLLASLILAMAASVLTVPQTKVYADSGLEAEYNALVTESTNGEKPIGYDRSTGQVIMITKARTASASSSLRWCTVGWDVSVTGTDAAGNKVVDTSFTVGNNSNFTLVCPESSINGYSYRKYAIPKEYFVSQLGSQADQCSLITVSMSAVLKFRWASDRAVFISRI